MEPEPEPPPPRLLADASNSRRSRRGIGDIPKPAPMNLTVCPMTDDVDLAFAAAERAGTLPRGFLRVRDAQQSACGIRLTVIHQSEDFPPGRRPTSVAYPKIIRITPW
jgi:hypothetical protein